MTVLFFKKGFKQEVILWTSFLIILLIFPFVKRIHFEPIEVGAVTQILHPEYPKGGISYDPYYHYNYWVAYVAKALGIGDGFEKLAPWFWFFETALAVFALMKLCRYVFKNDSLVSVIFVMTYLLGLSGQIDQKTLATPLYVLAIYFFLREKWIPCAVATGLIFYWHLGVAVWLFLPMCFGLGIKYFFYRDIRFRQLLSFPVWVTVTIIPLILFYLKREQTSILDEFTISYFYYSCWYCSSVWLTLTQEPGILISKLLAVFILLVGYFKAKTEGYPVKNIMVFALGILTLYIFNFILADVLRSGTVVTLQLLRSFLFIHLLSIFFLSFLLARQIRQGNFVFFIIFILLNFGYGFVKRFLGESNQGLCLIGFYFLFLTYEIWERKLSGFFPIAVLLQPMRNLPLIKNGSLLPVGIAFIFIVLFGIWTSFLKSSLKSLLNIEQSKIPVPMTAHEALFEDIAKFVNEKISDPQAILLVPFDNLDIDFSIHHKTFINSNTPIDNIQFRNKTNQFKEIFENDLKCSVEELAEEGFNKKWRELWQGLNEDLIRAWGRKYQLTHVIRESHLPLNFPIFYQNQYYVVYRIE